MPGERVEVRVECRTCGGEGGEWYQVCCGRGGIECCGQPDTEWAACRNCKGTGLASTPSVEGQNDGG